MTRRAAELSNRLEELLLEQAISGLDESQRTELEQLQPQGDSAANPFMETAALVQLGLASMDAANRERLMPASLRQKLLQDAPGGEAAK